MPLHQERAAVRSDPYPAVAVVAPDPFLRSDHYFVLFVIQTDPLDRSDRSFGFAADPVGYSDRTLAAG